MKVKTRLRLGRVLAPHCEVGRDSLVPPHVRTMSRNGPQLSVLILVVILVDFRTAHAQRRFYHILSVIRGLR